MTDPRPIRIRASLLGAQTEVRVLISHPMETGLRKDGSGALIPAHYITELSIWHQERLVLQARFGPSVAANPYLNFRFDGGAVGDKVSIEWLDNRGESQRESTQIVEGSGR